jgi:hypothetical protein
MAGPGNAWRLLQLHVVRPGRIVTPDLLLTRAFVQAPGHERSAISVQRLLTHPALQLEPGDWAVAPGWAAVRAMEIHDVPALGLWRDGALAWIFLARQALARADDGGPAELLLDGAPVAAPVAGAAPAGVVAAVIALAPPLPLGDRAAITLAARAGDLALAPTQVELERLA